MTTARCRPSGLGISGTAPRIPNRLIVAEAPAFSRTPSYMPQRRMGCPSTAALDSCPPNCQSGTYSGRCDAHHSPVPQNTARPQSKINKRKVSGSLRQRARRRAIACRIRRQCPRQSSENSRRRCINSARRRAMRVRIRCQRRKHASSTCRKQTLPRSRIL